MIQKAFGDDAMSAAQIQAWHECFKDGGESVGRDPRSGRPAASRTPGMLNMYALQSTKVSD